MGKSKRKRPDFSDQDFLMDFIHLFPNQEYSNKKKEDVKTNYDHFIQLEGEPGADINRMMISPFSATLKFNDFTAAHLSLLVPQVKLFRVFQQGDKTGEAQLPISNVQTVDSIIKSSEGRGTDVSFQSIKWEEQTGTAQSFGVNAHADFHGTMKLHFQSLEGIFMERGKIFDKSWGFFSLLHTEQARNSYLSRTESRIVDANPQWPLKIVVGYSVPDDANNSIFTQADIEIVRTLKQVLVVQSNHYAIDMDESGAVTLTIDFSGNLDVKSSSGIKYDLFLASGMSVRDQAIRSETDRLERESRNISKKINNKTELVSEADHEGLKKSNYGIQQKLYGLKSMTAKDAYAQLLTIVDNLKFGDGNPKVKANSESRESRLFYMDLDKAIIEQYIKLQEAAAKTIDQGKGDKALTTDQLKVAEVEKQKNLRVIYKLINKRINPDPNKTIGTVGALAGVQSHTAPAGEHAATPIAAAIAKLENVSQGKKGTTQGMKEWGKHYKSDKINKSGTNNSHRLNFFFLGDLVEAACLIIHDRPEIKQGCPPSLSGKQSKFQKEMWKAVRVILGTIRLKDPRQKLQNTADILTMSLADIPVSFSAFQAFWNSQVWAQGRTDYPLTQFLADICTHLIPNSVTSCVFGGRYRGLSENANLYKYKLPSSDVLDKIWKKGHAKRITLDEITEARWEAPDQGSNSQVNEYIHLQGAVAAPDFLKSRLETISEKVVYNAKHGIPTLYIGSNVGLVKKVSFNREKTPSSLKAENLARNADSSGANLLMADLYSCTVNLFGNPLMLNGMYVYINPRSLGLPDKLPETLAGQLNPMEWAGNVGLGGYYQINRVKHQIDSRGYSTSFYALPDNVVLGFETTKSSVPTVSPSPSPAQRSIEG